MKPALHRRHFFYGIFALASACSKVRVPSPLGKGLAKVSILKASHYQIDLANLIRGILIEHQLPVAGRRVVLKPNLVEFSPRLPINTNPIFVAAAAEAFRSLGAKTVTIAEGPGHRRATLDMAESAGFFSAIKGFEDNFVDLNLDDVSRVQLSQPFTDLDSLYLPHTILGADLLVSLPKMKTHHWAGATLSMKNLFGIVPGGVYGWPKNVLHWAGIDNSIADLHFAFPKQFCLVDGIEAMEGNGPIQGTAKHAGVIVGGAHPPSVDATCCQIMGIDPQKLKYLQLAASRSPVQIWQPRQIAEPIAGVAQKFRLHPDLQNLRLS
jgi:uncharacterized protein (DUF362 family)